MITPLCLMKTAGCFFQRKTRTERAARGRLRLIHFIMLRIKRQEKIIETNGSKKCPRRAPKKPTIGNQWAYDVAIGCCRLGLRTRVSDNKAGAFAVPGRDAWNMRGTAAHIRGSEKTEPMLARDSEPASRTTKRKVLLCRSETPGICTAPPRIFGVLSRERRMIREWHGHPMVFVPFSYGAPPGTRTLDPLIKSQLLYQLS